MVIPLFLIYQVDQFIGEDHDRFGSKQDLIRTKYCSNHAMYAMTEKGLFC